MSEFNAQEFVAQLGPEEIAALKQLLKASYRPKKEDSPEYQAAKAHLDAIIAENPELIERYNAAKEAIRAIKGSRRVMATKGYTLSADGIVSDKVTGEPVTRYNEEGWQSQMRAAGFTAGQVSAVAKKMRHAPVAA